MRCMLSPVLVQAAHVCLLHHKAGHDDASLTRAFEGLRGARPLLQRTLVPLLNNLAVAHLRLGQDSLALAYSITVQQLLFKATPSKAACIAVQVLNKLGHKAAAFTAAHYVRTTPRTALIESSWLRHVLRCSTLQSLRACWHSGTHVRAHAHSSP